MPIDNRSASQIEHEIEQNRAALAADLELLQQKLSLEGLVQQATSQLREHGGEIANSFSRSLRENPMAATMIALGVGWMMFGGRSGSEHHVNAPEAEQYRDRLEKRGNLASRQSNGPSPANPFEWAQEDQREARNDWRN